MCCGATGSQREKFYQQFRVWGSLSAIFPDSDTSWLTSSINAFDSVVFGTTDYRPSFQWISQLKHPAGRVKTLITLQAPLCLHRNLHFWETSKARIQLFQSEFSLACIKGIDVVSVPQQPISRRTCLCVRKKKLSRNKICNLWISMVILSVKLKPHHHLLLPFW